MKDLNLQWQGEPIETRFGYVMIKENKNKPLYWYNFECNTRVNHNKKYVPNYGLSGIALIEAIEIKQGDSKFVISNHFGIGVSKLLKGGWPNHTHFSLDGEFTQDNNFAIYDFDEIGYSNHEAERNKWQKENYPVEFKKLEDFKNSFKKTA